MMTTRVDENISISIPVARHSPQHPAQQHRDDEIYVSWGGMLIAKEAGHGERTCEDTTCSTTCKCDRQQPT
jgi:hypothetical protein